jgi:Ribosome inactivating protein
MRAMAPAISQVVEGARKVKGDSTAVHEITVTAGDTSVLLYVAENQFYMLGFRTTAGTVYRFKDKEIPGQAGATSLGIGCSYVGSQSLEIYEAADAVQDAKRNRESIITAVKKLAGFAGGSSAEVKNFLAILVFFICESLRFTKIFGRMVKVANEGNTFSFREFQTLVQSWSAISTGANPPGTTKADVYILQA